MLSVTLSISCAQLDDVLPLDGGDELPGQPVHHVVLAHVSSVLDAVERWPVISASPVGSKSRQRGLQNLGGLAGVVHQLHERLKIVDSPVCFPLPFLLCLRITEKIHINSLAIRKPIRSAAGKGEHPGEHHLLHHAPVDGGQPLGGPHAHDGGGLGVGGAHRHRRSGRRTAGTAAAARSAEKPW